jgi:hypothetical protein
VQADAEVCATTCDIFADLRFRHPDWCFRAHERSSSEVRQSVVGRLPCLIRQLLFDFLLHNLDVWWEQRGGGPCGGSREWWNK